MPLLKFKCCDCGHVFDELVSSSATANVACPSCEAGRWSGIIRENATLAKKRRRRFILQRGRLLPLLWLRPLAARPAAAISAAIGRLAYMKLYSTGSTRGERCHP